jgi:hypothetical protein
MRTDHPRKCRSADTETFLAWENPPRFYPVSGLDRLEKTAAAALSRLPMKMVKKGMTDGIAAIPFSFKS